MKTTIEYTDEVSNPLFARPIGDEKVKIGTFCEKPDKDGTCENCWAETLNLRFGNKLTFDKANRSKIEWIYKEKPMQRLRSLNADKRESERNPGNPLMVFCCDTFDLFQPSISDDLRNRLFDEYDKFTNLTLQIQTTYPAKMNHYITSRYGFDVPNHYWFGMSAGTQEFLDENVHYLLDIYSSVRYVIFEPLLERIDASNYFYTRFQQSGLHHEQNVIDWVIIGGESGNQARPCSIHWIRALLKQAKEAKFTKVLVKQLGSKPVWGSPMEPAIEIKLKSAKGKDMSEWMCDLRMRKFPKL